MPGTLFFVFVLMRRTLLFVLVLMPAE